MTDDKDRRLLMSLLSIFYSRELIEKDCYELCEGGLYYVPAHSPYQVVPAFNPSSSVYIYSIYERQFILLLFF